MKDRATELFEQLIAGGATAVDALIEQSASEELFLDFKRSADNGGGTSLHNRDRANLAKAISGFGNGEGGVIVWGIECSRSPTGDDVASQRYLIRQPKRFKGWLDGASSGLTVPVHRTVVHSALDRDGQEGYVCTLVPSSEHAPHQVTGEMRYYMRAGSNFLPVQHGILAGMFGRRPQPKLIFQWLVPEPEIYLDLGVGISVGFVLKNIGRGIAEHVYANMAIWNSPSKDSKLSFGPPDKDLWFGQFSFGIHISVIARDGVRIPPNAFLSPFSVNMLLLPPFIRPLEIEIAYGASNQEMSTYRLKTEPDQLGVAIEAWHLALLRGEPPSSVRDIISNAILAQEPLSPLA